MKVVQITVLDVSLIRHILCHNQRTSARVSYVNNSCLLKSVRYEVIDIDTNKRVSGVSSLRIPFAVGTRLVEQHFDTVNVISDTDINEL